MNSPYLKTSILIISITGLSLKNNKPQLNTEPEKPNYIPYYHKMYEADSLFQINEYEKTYFILDKLFKIYPPLSSDNYAEYGTYVSCAVMSGHLDSISEKVKYGYTHFGGISTLHKEYFVDTVNNAARLTFKEIEALQKQYYNSLNEKLRTEMLEMIKQDQEARENNNFEEIAKTDDLNRKKLEDILKTYGYPDNNLIGATTALDIPGGDINEMLLFVHQPADFKIKYLPFLLEAVKNGKCSPMLYATVYDRLKLKEVKKQYYGSFNCNNDGGTTCELIDPKKIDSIRHSIGLPHINYYSWRLNKILGK